MIFTGQTFVFAVQTDYWICIFSYKNADYNQSWPTTSTEPVSGDYIKEVGNMT